jgi:hypothetical protein
VIEAFKRFDPSFDPTEEQIILISMVKEALGHSASLSHFFWPSGLGF